VVKSKPKVRDSDRLIKPTPAAQKNLEIEEEKKESLNEVGSKNKVTPEPASSNRQIEEEKKVMPSKRDSFVQIEADSNELSVKVAQSPRRSGKEEVLNKPESDRVSFSRAISLYRASCNNSQ